MMERTRSSINLRVSGVTVRMDAASSALPGITFGASPDWNFPTETTAISPGVTLRDTTV